MIEYVITLTILALSVSGLSKLYQYLIHPSEFLGFVNKWIVYFKDKNVFIYKSIGGCSICNTQRFADIFFLIHSCYYINFVTWYSFIIYYVLFGGLVFYLTVITEKNKIVDQKKETEKIEL